MKEISTPSAPIKVLLVEDNLESAFLTRAHLETGDNTFHVEWSANLAEGMSRLAKPGIDVVVLDLGLPELNGHTCYRAVASMAGRTLPIVILTSDDRPLSRQRTLGFGTTRYLLKNQASPAEIRQAVRDAMRQPKTQPISSRRTTIPPKLPLPKILVVDDQQESLFLIQTALSGVEADLVSVTSGAEALARLEREAFALVLLDISMPEMNGFEVAQRLRSSDRSRGYVPIILVTALFPDAPSAVKQDHPSQLMGYSSGAVDYMSKPINPAILRSKVEVFLTMFQERKAWETANDKHLTLQMDLAKTSKHWR